MRFLRAAPDADRDVPPVGAAARRHPSKAHIAARLLRLANGLAGDASPVGQGVHELRIHYGPGYRVYFQWRGSDIVVLLCGGDKSSQDRDIRTALRLAAEWNDDDA
ncbi:type II toxin-antitoxin system RelE/ParE family toxin [Methylobacterium isbiliense]|uniref:type II toxin-antitoxin system RelE/ParE family toxin n=1 Tax=Methylobacterium isbiliense TaxID=315478 RepID=UPI002795E968|nr:type II toxin-antitoxin system RelE/ParE family toxin [Methylobacterium isbiliense]